MGDWAEVGLHARLMSRTAQAHRHIKRSNSPGDLHQSNPHEDWRDVRIARNSPAAMPRFYASLVRLDIRRTGSIKKGDEVIGNETRVKVWSRTSWPRPSSRPNLKSPLRRRRPRVERNYRSGRQGWLIDKSGVWYSCAGTGQAAENARSYLKENPRLRPANWKTGFAPEHFLNAPRRYRLEQDSAAGDSSDELDARF